MDWRCEINNSSDVEATTPAVFVESDERRFEIFDSSEGSCVVCRAEQVSNMLGERYRLLVFSSWHADVIGFSLHVIEEVLIVNKLDIISFHGGKNGQDPIAACFFVLNEVGVGTFIESLVMGEIIDARTHVSVDKCVCRWFRPLAWWAGWLWSIVAVTAVVVIATV